MGAERRSSSCANPMMNCIEESAGMSFSTARLTKEINGVRVETNMLKKSFYSDPKNPKKSFYSDPKNPIDA